jgi:hypothetical protein
VISLPAVNPEGKVDRVGISYDPTYFSNSIPPDESSATQHFLLQQFHIALPSELGSSPLMWDWDAGCYPSMNVVNNRPTLIENTNISMDSIAGQSLLPSTLSDDSRSSESDHYPHIPPGLQYPNIYTPDVPLTPYLNANDALNPIEVSIERVLEVVSELGLEKSRLPSCQYTSRSPFPRPTSRNGRKRRESHGEPLSAWQSPTTPEDYDELLALRSVILSQRLRGIYVRNLWRRSN